MFERKYLVRYSMGDGLPFDECIVAKNGLAAREAGAKRHPHARYVYLIGLAPETMPSVATSDPDPQLDLDDYARRHHDYMEMERNDQISTCVMLRNKGITHAAIAKQLGVGKSTIGRWLKQYG